MDGYVFLSLVVFTPVIGLDRLSDGYRNFGDFDEGSSTISILGSESILESIALSSNDKKMKSVSLSYHGVDVISDAADNKTSCLLS